MKTRPAVDQENFFREAAGALAIDPVGKLATKQLGGILNANSTRHSFYGRVF